MAARLETVEEVQAQHIAASMASPAAGTLASATAAAHDLADVEERLRDLERRSSDERAEAARSVARIRSLEEGTKELKTVAALADRLTKLAFVCQGLNQRISKLSGETL